MLALAWRLVQLLAPLFVHELVIKYGPNSGTSKPCECDCHKIQNKTSVDLEVVHSKEVNTNIRDDE